MDIRNIIHQKKENRKKRNLIITITIIILLLLFLLASSISKNRNKPQYNIWDNIQISGTIVSDNNYPTNTHKIFNHRQEFGLKSSSINLNNLIDKPLILNWTIESISKKYPLLNINNIKDPESKLIINDNKYFFTNELISFDFSQDTEIKAQKIDWKIQVHYQDKWVVSFETFICNKITPTQDCEKMIESYINNLNERFTTYQGYTFYKLNETSWITFNNTTLWYIVKTTDNDFLLNISHLINIVDSNFLAKNKSQLIKDNCKIQSWIYLDIFDKIETQIIDENLFKFDISGITNKQERYNCKLIIDIWNNRNIKNTTLNKI